MPLNEVGEVREHVPLAPFTTLGIGGPARYFVEARTEAEIIEALRFANARDLRVFAFGGGSNVVVSDAGFAGLALHVALRGIERSRGIVSVAAGEPWGEFVDRVVDAGLAGVECLAGIPGSVGATPIQNVGAYGQEVGEVITVVRTIDIATLEARERSAEECAFAYRDSAFKHELAGREIVTRVDFALTPDGPPAIKYAELARAAKASFGDNPTLAQVRSKVVELRRSKSMVIDEQDENRRSVGSFFTNPIVSHSQAELVTKRAIDAGIVASPSEIPKFAIAGDSERVKLAAGWLIERAGFVKGTRVGNVGISSKHALALVHHGGGSAIELLALARHIREGVRAKFDVELEMEPVVIGNARF